MVLNTRWLLLFGVWMLYGSFGLVAGSLAPVASLVIEDLQMTHAEMGLAMGAWQLVYIFSAVPAGILLDRVGVRYALVLGGSLQPCSQARQGNSVNRSAGAQIQITSQASSRSLSPHRWGHAGDWELYEGRST